MLDRPHKKLIKKPHHNSLKTNNLRVKISDTSEFRIHA
jgi:hypothetical protein